MRAGSGMRKDVREENALIDLGAVLVALHLLTLRRDLRARRHETGNQIGSGVDQRLGAQERGLTLSQCAINRLGMTGQKCFAALAADAEDALRSAQLFGVAFRLVG